MHLYRLSALFEQVTDFACVILAHASLKQSLGALPQVFCRLQQGLIIYRACTQLLFDNPVFYLLFDE